MRNILLIAIAAGVLAACAQQQGRPGEAKANPYCLQDTGSRIPPKEGECKNGPGRSVSREELERTGRPNTADALRQVDQTVH